MGGGVAGGVQGAGKATGISLHIGIGGGSSTTTGKTHDDVAYGSKISSNGNVAIAATGGDLNVIGSQISGKIRTSRCPLPTTSTCGECGQEHPGYG